MSVAILHSRAISGMDAAPVTVEAHLANGLPSFTIVGLPETEVKEAKDRVRAALQTARFEFPARRITVNLAPADLPKESGRFDLAIALGILAASEQLPSAALDQYEFAGELALTGELRPIRGALAMTYVAHRSGRAFVLPEANAPEAALVRDATVYAANSLLQVCAHLTGAQPLQQWSTSAQSATPSYPDMGDVKGQAQAKRALEIAAAGNHSILLMWTQGPLSVLQWSPMPIRAYSYLRFSTPEQSQGDSFRRQTQAAREYARKHGLILDEKLAFEDLGVSAFRSKNAKTGALRAFLDAVEGGIIAPGSFLLVESLDRVSRDDILAAQGLFLEIINADIVLVTLMDGRKYSKASVNANPFDLLASLVILIRANEESAVKARRLSAAWHGKRESARQSNKPLTAQTPGWIRLDKRRAKFALIPERATTIKRVFQMTLDGMGQHGIAKEFNRDGTPAFSRDSGRTEGAIWRRSYIVKILNNPAAVGTYIPHRYEYIDGKRTRTPLEPITGYFPAVIDQETWEAARALLDGRRGPRRPAPGLVNLLGGLATCPLCASSMVLVNKGAKRGGHRKLVCSTAKAGAGCTYRGVGYEQVEDALVNHYPWLTNDKPTESPEEAQLVQALLDIDIVTDITIDKIQDTSRALETAPKSKTLAARLMELEGDLEVQRKEERNIRARLESIARTMLDRKIALLEEAMVSQPMNKERINACLRGLFERVVVDYLRGELTFHWRGGGTTEIMYAWPADT